MEQDKSDDEPSLGAAKCFSAGAALSTWRWSRSLPLLDSHGTTVKTSTTERSAKMLSERKAENDLRELRRLASLAFQDEDEGEQLAAVMDA